MHGRRSSTRYGTCNVGDAFGAANSGFRSLRPLVSSRVPGHLWIKGLHLYCSLPFHFPSFTKTMPSSRSFFTARECVVLEKWLRLPDAPRVSSPHLINSRLCLWPTASSARLAETELLGPPLKIVVNSNPHYARRSRRGGGTRDEREEREKNIFAEVFGWRRRGEEVGG